MNKGIIFDVDGTLWDAAAQVAESWNVVLGRRPQLDIQVTLQDMYDNMGKTMTEFANAILPNLPAMEARAVMEECMAFENQYLETHPGTLYPQVKETIQSLSAEYGLYIVSNCQKGYIEALLKSHGLGEYFRDTESFGGTGLPKGENIRLVIQRNQLDKCFYVGDTCMDKAASDIAGIPFVLAAYGYGSAEKAAGRIDSMAELPALAHKLLD